MNYPRLTFTITTFKRPHLFKRTMESFLETCNDLDLFDVWLIGDDGSPEEEIQDMIGDFPFFNVLKNPRQGQASNLNNLFSHVKTEWFFHCEDDWLFQVKDSYIRKLLDIVLENSLIKNAILRSWRNGEEAITSKGIKYNIHRYDPTVSEEDSRVSDSWWYGYSLNPGIQHKPTIEFLGKYRENMVSRRKWDKEIALKYRESGLRRANLIGNYIEHIGQDESAYKLREQ